MDEIFPKYLKDFKCISSSCKHSCCIGWEIDIDDNSLQRFKRDGIKYIEESCDSLPHFKLKYGDICPYLRDDNLCQMIIDHGEDYICNICKDHPRFRNYYSGFNELGIGLACEEAARLILSQEKPLELETSNGKRIDEYVNMLPEDEKYLWNVRNKILEEASSLSDPLQARLAEYFAYRQIPDALYDGLLKERISFVWYSVNEITNRWNKQEDQSFEALSETAREYSEYYEYNTERLNKLLNSLK